MIDLSDWMVILLLTARLTAFTSIAPFYGIRGVPPALKGAFGLLLAVLLFPIVQQPETLAGLELLTFVLLLLGEVLVGLAIGYVASLVFASIKIAGQLIDVQMGLAMASLFDPQSGSQNTIVGQFLDTLGILLFMLIDGHHRLLAALAKSYELIPLGNFRSFEGALVQEIVRIFGGTFILGLKIAAPVIAVLIVVDVTLGLVARTVPQLNVFILGFPLKIGLGILTLAVVAPLLATVCNSIFGIIEKDLFVIMRYL